MDLFSGNTILNHNVLKLLFFSVLLRCAAVYFFEFPVEIRQVSKSRPVTNVRNAVLFLLQHFARPSNTVFC